MRERLGLNGESRTGEALPVEAVEIRLARELVAGWDQVKADEMFSPSTDPKRKHDALERLTLAKRMIRVYNRLGEEVLSRIARAVSATEFSGLIVELGKVQPKNQFEALQEELAQAKTPADVRSVIQCLLDIKYVMGRPILDRGHSRDMDDSDYKMPAHLKVDLPVTADSKEVMVFGDALHDKDASACVKLLKAHTDWEFDDRMQETARAVAQELIDWSANVLEEHHDRLQNVPQDAQEINVYHAGFDRTRRIAPFARILLRKMSGSLLGYAVREMENSGVNTVDKPSPEETAARVRGLADELFNKSLDLYQEVDLVGLPVFRAMAEYLTQEADRQEQIGEEWAGEFHVGRDTLTTTFMASHALRWGKLPAKERLEKIRHVFISRPLLEKGGYARIFLKNFIEQEGINQTMTGVDGGYQGSNPEAVLTTLNPKLTLKKASDRIRLIAAATENKEAQRRRFTHEVDYQETVQWMESLPKFTDRALDLEEVGVGRLAKYMVVTKPRSESEQLLAWTVQHATWRGMIPKGMRTEKPTVGPHALERQREYAAELEDATSESSV